MDSLTQLIFGAACGEAVLGKRVGRKALVWGALVGTLPDLDVFIPQGSPVNDFAYHRGFSHSLFVLCLLSPCIAWLITKIHPKTRKHYGRWLLLCFVALETSALLDLLNIYGTRIFWPFDTSPKAIPVFFIIDPLFALPILLGVLSALVLKRQNLLGHKLNSIGLTLSLSYLIWALGAGEYVRHHVAEKLAHQRVSHSQFVSSPAPFTTLLWRVVGIDGDQYFETYYSLFDEDTALFIDYYPRNLHLMKGLEKHPPVITLKDFTKGYFAFSQVDDEYVAMTDLRMGTEPNYVFGFKVGKLDNAQSTPVDDQRLETRRDWQRLSWIWRKIWNTTPQL